MLGSLDRFGGLPRVQLQEGQQVMRFAPGIAELDGSLQQVLAVFVFLGQHGEVQQDLVAIDAIEVFKTQGLQTVFDRLFAFAEKEELIVQIESDVLRLLVSPEQDVEVAFLRSGLGVEGLVNNADVLADAHLQGVLVFVLCDRDTLFVNPVEPCRRASAE